MNMICDQVQQGTLTRSTWTKNTCNGIFGKVNRHWIQQSLCLLAGRSDGFDDHICHGFKIALLLLKNDLSRRICEVRMNTASHSLRNLLEIEIINEIYR